MRLKLLSLLGASVLLASEANAAIETWNLSWTGDAGYSMSGSFSYDTASAGDNLITENELTSFSVSFFDPSNVLLKAYGLLDQNGFNFNFETSTGLVRQTGVPFDDFHLLIGSMDDYHLPIDNFCGGTGTFFRTGSCSSKLDDNGTVIATRATVAVPEPSTLALFGAALAGLGFMRRKRRTA